MDDGYDLDGEKSEGYVERLRERADDRRSALATEQDAD